MHIQLIGENISKFLIMISGFYSSRKAKQSDRKFIEDFWDFDYSQNEQLNIQIDNYIKKLKEYKNSENQSKNIRKCFIIKIKGISDPLTETILQKISKLRESH